MPSPETTRPVWDEAAPPQKFVPLREDLEADVCVVGAGIAGMSVAYELAAAGRRVIVLDTDAVGGGQTVFTTAHLASAQDDRFFVLERLHGQEGSRIAYHSHQAALERIGAIAAAEGIDCDFQQVDGFLFLAEGDSEDTLRRELEAAHRAGFGDVELLPRAPGAGWDTGSCLRFPRQARFHPLKYLHGLAKAIHERGGRIFTDTHAAEIQGGSDAHVRTADGHTVRARAVVVATNSPVNDQFVIHTKQAPYLSYAIAARVPRGAAGDALLWDTGDPYTYIRIQRGAETDDHDFLIVGGEDVHTGDDPGTGEQYRTLEAWARARFPVESVPFRWSGQVYEPVDYLGYIGRNPADADNVFIATGDSGQGMTHGAIAGILISDLILGRDNPWSKLYEPGRVTLRATSVKEFVRANLEVANYYTEWVRGTDDEAEAESQVLEGQGRVVRMGGKPVAVFRSDEGELHRMSAVCPHLGCIVHWNDTASSWDCPCHGSRFQPTGEVINGPSLSGLEPVEGRADG